MDKRIGGLPTNRRNLLGLSFCVVQFNGGPAAIKIRIIIISRADQFHSKPSGRRRAPEFFYTRIIEI